MSKMLLLGVLTVAFVDTVVGVNFTCQPNNDLVDYNRVQSYVDEKMAPVSQRVQAVQDKINAFVAKFESYKRDADAERSRLSTKITTLETNVRRQKGDADAERSRLSTRITTLETNFRRQKECYGNVGDGRGYRGTISRTKSGKTCQNWTSQSPQSHSRTPDNYPHHGLGNHNFCRNPDGEDGPWCYTTDSNSRWEYCPVSDC